MRELDKDSFKDAISKDAVLVDFWAPWCGPCRAIAPVLDKLEKEFEGKLSFAKLNVDDNRELAQENGIMGIPCIIIFKDGKEATRIVGAFSEPVLKTKIQEAL